ncbi:ABC-2 type transport system ATP-binding protein [Asanoa ferruginea]|uniref:ABC-2 type transport system ATP-binding protein n=1 Tax=Asanoa ferruginea TaxID=53367 RepID=A0A3D9ZMC4_9ACTN|nr:ABC transporter ATP-binding protein [Asanoa ferruginea]REF94800.1 ABC-2 type transport system ATP-binding protein [Asanoa ferruginea]GIF45622.1 daunorubicin resistance protein DrrA family ABC transporter ATP-binding protein [Asanoa ferruginea]
MAAPVIEVDGLARTFRSRKGLFRRPGKEIEAVKGVSFTVERGELFGLLGPNGAGKTTTIKMLITLLLPTAGRAQVLGHDVVADARDLRRKVGYVFGGDRGLYERLSGLDNLRYFAELYGVPPRESKQRVAELLDLVGLTGREKERVEGYSRGMRQRLHIARGLLHRPEVLFLDEPSIGIDPVGARELRATVKNLVETGTTVLLTTHYMFEADELCDRIAVIAQGRIVALDTPHDLKQQVTTGTVLEIEVFGLPDGLVEKVRAEQDVQSVMVDVRGQAEVLAVHARPGTDVTQTVMRHLDGSRFGRVITREPTLEDAYIELVNAA